MVHANRETDGADGSDCIVDPALLALVRLRREVELQEQRVRVMELRKQQRDALLSQLRSTLSRTQPIEFREFAAAAEQILCEPATDAERAVPCDDAQAVFTSSVGAQLAAEAETGTSSAPAAATVDDFLEKEEATHEERRKRKKKRMRGKQHRKKAQQPQLHVDPVASPEGFDFTKARNVNQKKAGEEAAHRERLCALLDDLVARRGPLPTSTDTASGEPAWLAEGEGGESERQIAKEETTDEVLTESSVTVKVVLSSQRPAEEDYPDDFEEEDVSC